MPSFPYHPPGLTQYTQPDCCHARSRATLEDPDDPARPVGAWCDDDSQLETPWFRWPEEAANDRLCI